MVKNTNKLWATSVDMHNNKNKLSFKKKLQSVFFTYVVQSYDNIIVLNM